MIDYETQPTSTGRHVELMNKIRGVVSDVADEISFDGGWPRVDPVAWQGYDGFIPFTDGGFDAVVAFDLHGSVAHDVALLAPALAADYTMCKDEFRREHELADDAEVEEHESWEDWRDAWEQGDSSDQWFVKVRALHFAADGVHSRRNETGQDEFLFCIGINDDFGYGRDSISWCRGVGTTWVWEETVPADDLTDEKLEAVKAALLEAWSNA